jgi:hypothetical protein
VYEPENQPVNTRQAMKVSGKMATRPKQMNREQLINKASRAPNNRDIIKCESNTN